MQRRDFLKAIGAVALAPFVPEIASADAGENPLFRGELGRWEGIRFYSIDVNDPDRHYIAPGDPAYYGVSSLVQFGKDGWGHAVMRSGDAVTFDLICPYR